MTPSLTTLEITLLVLLLVFPLFDLVLDRYPFKNRNIEYIKISAISWAITGFLIYLFYAGELSVKTLPEILPHTAWKIYLAAVLFTLWIAYTIYLLRLLVTNETLRQETVAKLEASSNAVVGLLPQSRSQLLLFTLLVSVTAGICEELIFRWYLYHFLALHSHWLVAVCGSSVVFGLWHLYQGWQNVFKTSGIGGLLCLVYLYFDSILLAIVLHSLLDISSGLFTYYARSPNKLALSNS